ncbi:MAG: SusF/SusE family outer membrane protein [Bacteroidales bacterium]|nr:SusF/SusE family outer membrane protein [Bacteroidales bacterium]
MKKIFSFLSIAAMAFAIVGCQPKDPEGPDVNKITEDGFYVVGEATGISEVTADLTMANGINEADNQSAREGMFEKYIVLQGGKEFTLAYVSGGQQTAYGAELTEFKADLSDALYADNPADAVFKGKLVVGDSAPKMKVSQTGLYHIVLDLNKNKDIEDAQIVLCPVTMGVRGGMNSWGFTPFEASEYSNSGITFTLSGQELAKAGEFKFAYNNAWKITLGQSADGSKQVKANTNLGMGCKPGGDNIVVNDGAGKYKITLTYKLASGDIANSFKYTVELESASAAPETMYMIGAQFGDWKWEDAGVVELIPVWGKAGEFWCTRYFEADKGFKFCATKAWNGDFTGAGTAGYTVNDGNCWVAENGFYTVYIDGNENSVEISPAEVYGIGAAFGDPAEWDFDKAPKFVADGDKLTIPVIAAEEMRMAVKVQPSVAKDGITGNGWYDWWKTEFIFFDGKIAYRGAGNDQDRVKGEAGKTLVLDFNAGTAEYIDGSGPAVGGTAITNADELIAYLANPDSDASLEADIDLTGKPFTIGTLTGTFDGKGHTVTYSVTAEPTDVNVGLFAVVNGTVKNLKAAGSIETKAVNAGGIAASAGEGAVFENCESAVEIAGTMQASYRFGGIVGLCDKNVTIKNCVNNGKIGNTVPNMGNGNAIQLGGIVGHLEETGSVEGCTNNGELYYEAKGTPRMGGMCGYFNKLVEGSFTNCTNNGNLRIASNAESGYNYVGGITGYYGTPNDASHVVYNGCVNTGNITFSAGVSATSYRAGGILCHCGGTNVKTDNPLSVEVLNCSNSGNISADGPGSKTHLGGIIGFTETVTCIVKCDGCTNTGSISGANGKGVIGGIHGYSCNPASTFTNFTVGKDVVLTSAAGGRLGLVIGAAYTSTAAIPDAELNTALTGKILGGKLVAGETTTEVTAENYKSLLFAAAVIGSIDGVTFGE